MAAETKPSPADIVAGTTTSEKDVVKQESSTKEENVESVTPPASETPPVKPQVSQVAPQITPVVEKTTVKQEDTPKSSSTVADQYMTDYIARYLEFNNGVLDSATQRKKAISAFQTIMLHALKHPTTGVLDQVTALFSNQDTRTRVLNKQLALQGLDRLSASDQMRLSVFYSTFMTCTSSDFKKGKKSKVSLDKVRDILKNDNLINYLTIKFGM